MNLALGVLLLYSSPFQSPFQNILNRIHLKIWPQTAGFQTQEPGRWGGGWRELINRRGGRGSWRKLALLKWFKISFLFFLSCRKDVPEALLHCPVHGCCSWMVCRKEDGLKTAAFLVRDDRTQLSPRHRSPENISSESEGPGAPCFWTLSSPFAKTFFPINPLKARGSDSQTSTASPAPPDAGNFLEGKSPGSCSSSDNNGHGHFLRKWPFWEWFLFSQGHYLGKTFFYIHKSKMWMQQDSEKRVLVEGLAGTEFWS